MSETLADFLPFGVRHVTLHPNDVKIVLEAGWGERHPLAGVFKRWFVPQLPAGFIMLYAPQDDDEIEVVLKVISAAAAFVNGKEIESGMGLEYGAVEEQRSSDDIRCIVAMNATSIVSAE